MPLVYEPPPTSGSLRQGEILSGVWEHRPRHPAIELDEDFELPVKSYKYPWLIVMTADCDLNWDYEAREKERKNENEVLSEDGEEPRDIETIVPSIVPHILLCRAFEAEEIRHREGMNSGVWKRITKGQDERYHSLITSTTEGNHFKNPPDLYIDFKKSLSLPTDLVYEGLEPGTIGRAALIPPLYIHDLMHRFYSFLSRVGVPE